MAHYIALIHKDEGSIYGAQFPDVPGVTAVGGSLDEVITEAAAALSFAAEDWQELTGSPFPNPRTLDDLRDDPDYRQAAQEAVVAAIDPGAKRLRPAAE